MSFVFFCWFMDHVHGNFVCFFFSIAFRFIGPAGRHSDVGFLLRSMSTLGRRSALSWGKSATSASADVSIPCQYNSLSPSLASTANDTDSCSVLAPNRQIVIHNRNGLTSVTEEMSPKAVYTGRSKDGPLLYVLLPEMDENDGGLLGDVLNPGAEAGIVDDDADPSGCWVMIRRRLCRERPSST